jgi:hypothetical protein
MTPGQHDAAMIHHLRRGQCRSILDCEFGAFQQRAAAGRTPVGNRLFRQHGAAMAAKPFHSFQITGSGRISGQKSPPSRRLSAFEKSADSLGLNKFFLFKELFVCKRDIALYNFHEETHGRRYSTYVQRLRAGLHLHRCGSDVLSGTWLFDPKTL